MSFHNIAVVSVKGKKYRIDFWYIAKDEAIHFLRNVDLTGKSKTL